jgi:hypothetical protein
VRSHVVATRLRRDRGLDHGPRFQIQLGTSATLNLVSRSLLGQSFDRVLFHSTAGRLDGDGVSELPSELDFQDFRTHRYALTAERVRPALLASGSIPLLMEGVRTMPDVPGTLFDGGILDYHFDFGFRRREGLVLFAHFFDRIVPGWFDKPLPWRRPKAASLEDVVMIAPSNAFVASLPGGKVPDRNDFLTLSTGERIDRWREIVARCSVLAEELDGLIESKRFVDALLPFD